MKLRARLFKLVLMSGIFLISLAVYSPGIIPASAQDSSPYNKPSPASEQPLTGDFVPGELIVALAPGGDLGNITSSLNNGLRNRSITGLPLEEIPEQNAVVIQVPTGQEVATAALLEYNPDVLFAEPNYIVRADIVPDDPAWSDASHPDYIYGPEHVQAPDAWDTTTGSSSIILAIIDTGLDTGDPDNIHPEFSGRVLPGYDFYDGDSTPQDTDLCNYVTHYHHGTHVGGIAAATGNNTVGMAGINWQAKILPVRFMNSCGSGTVSTMAQAIDYAIANGAKVINISSGLSYDSSLIRKATYNAYRSGVALIAAAGNNNGGPILYPAVYPWVLAVGATDIYDARASLSNIGSSLDIMAPGIDIYSTQPMHSPENGYGLKSGTSMATPLVAGAAALLAGMPLFNTPDKIYYALTHNAHDIGNSGFDTSTGYGLMQINDALEEDLSDFIPSLLVEYDILVSSRCSSENYSWLDATETSAGGKWMLISGDDDHQSLSIPFTFTFATQQFTSVNVSSNGYVTFSSDDDSHAANQALPSAATPDMMIAPFWDDLNPSACDPAVTHCGVYYRAYGTSPNRYLVIEWYRIPFANNTLQEATFETVLYETSGQVKFQYLNPSGSLASGESATIGLNYDTGRDGVLFSFNRAGAVNKGLAVRFVPRTPGVTATYEPDCLYSAAVTSGQDQTISLGNFCLNIPAGLVPQGKLVDFSLSTFSSFSPLPSYVSIHRFADIALKPSPSVPFDPAPSVCYSYKNSDILAGGGHAENLFIAAYDEMIGAWEKLPTSLDIGNRLLTAPASHFSVFGVFGSRAPQALPSTGAPIAPAAVWLGVFVCVLITCALASRPHS